jgi:hypothetical protein
MNTYEIITDTYVCTKKQSDNIVTKYEIILEKLNKSEQDLSKCKLEFMNIELLKIPIFIKISDQYIKNNYSVIIIVNYIETLTILQNRLKTISIIYNNQTEKEKEILINNFILNKSKILIIGIDNIKYIQNIFDSVDDSVDSVDNSIVNNTHTNILSIISPIIDTKILLQTLNITNKSLRRIVYISKTPEESISKKLYNIIL